MTLLAAPRASRGATRVRTASLLPLVVAALDLVIVCVAGVAAAHLRTSLPVFTPSPDIADRLGIAGPAIVVGWITMTTLVGGYGARVMGTGTEEFRRVLRAGLLTIGTVGVVCYLVKFPLSRGFFFLMFAVGLPALLLGRWAARAVLHSLHRRGRLLRGVVIAGTPGQVDELAAVLRRENWLGYDVLGALTPSSSPTDRTHSDVPILGRSADATRLVVDSGADILFLAGGALESSSQLRRIAWVLEHSGVQVVVAPGVTDVAAERVRVRPVGGLPLIHIDPPRASGAARWGKRTFDLAGAAALLLVFGPLLALAAVRIRLDDGGPVLFRQTRIGRNGNEFACLKLRTMVVDAEARLTSLRTETGHDVRLFKLPDDPRITPPGRWLRRFSMDELPQLVNVLRGEMSLVGPRPPLPHEVAVYDHDTVRRLRVLPGMTGLWQVSGRSDLSWEEAVRLDLYYVDNWSMLQDLSILARTFGAVFARRGAY